MATGCSNLYFLSESTDPSINDAATGRMTSNTTQAFTDSHWKNLEIYDQSYFTGEFLGENESCNIFAGVRRKDDVPVTIKYLPKDKIKKYADNNGENLPMEIYFMKSLYV